MSFGKWLKQSIKARTYDNIGSPVSPIAVVL